MHLPSPGWLGSLSATNRRRNRGGLSFGMRRVGPVCGSGLQGGCAPVGHAAGTCCGAREWAQKWTGLQCIVGMGAHVCPCLRVKRQDRSCVMSEYGSYVTNVRV